MTKPVIVTRAGKGLALTYAEQDSNFTNLRDATLGITSGGSTITANLNGTLSINAGTGITIDTDTFSNSLTIKRTAEYLYVNAPDIGTFGYPMTDTLIFAAGSGISITGNSSTHTLTITNTSNTNLASPSAIGSLTPNAATFTTTTTNVLEVPYVTGGSSNVVHLNPSQGGSIEGMSIGTTRAAAGKFTDVTVGSVSISNNTVSGVTQYYGAIGTSISNAAGYFSTLNSASTTTLGATTAISLNNTPIGSSTASTGAFTTLSATTSITGPLFGYKETIHALGSITNATITPNAAQGNIKTLTLNGTLTFNAFGTPVAGQSMTLIITHGQANNTLSSTMKFSGGLKTLSTSSGSIDVLHVFYDGTNYLASLNRGFA